MKVKRFDVYLVSLDPTKGRKVKKTRPCLIISPNEMNRHISTVIVAPMTSRGNSYPTRIPCQFQGVKGQVVLDQIRTIDKNRMVKQLGSLSQVTQSKVLDSLAAMFAP